VKDDRTTVIIKADREVPHGFVQEVARTVNAIEGVKFYVGVQDKKGG
jgi:biopolymer transport protein ExbD